jgi:peptidyl-prolyl cis-trans isomerase SurA
MRFFILALTLIIGSQSTAQGTFQPVITVNDRAITGFELDQRKRMLEVFRTPGNLDQVAREALIEDRLKEAELDRAGLRMAEDSLQSAMAEFAGRANLELDQFIKVLAANNVSEETLRDFVRTGASWRDYVRSRFGPRVTITDADVDRAIAQNGSGGAAIEVLLSEIIIAAPPPRAAQAMATATRISQLRSTSAFEAQARRVSALPSKRNGGRLNWLPITNYPPQLQSIILGLAPGEVTAPLPITNGVALFQMRAIREVKGAALAPTSIDYTAFYLAGGRSDAGVRAAQNLADNVDTCDDLFGEAQDLPENVLDRQDLSPADIPQDVALELARLDAGEVSYNLTRADGQTLMFLMLCGRTNPASEGVDPSAVRNQLRSQRLAGFADALLGDLRSSATITTR